MLRADSIVVERRSSPQDTTADGKVQAAEKQEAEEGERLPSERLALNTTAADHPSAGGNDFDLGFPGRPVEVVKKRSPGW